MKKLLLSLFLILLSSTFSFSQICPNDAVIIEDENLTVWKVATNGGQVFSLAEFQGDVTVGGVGYFQDDFGFDSRGLILMAHDTLGTFQWAQRINGTAFFTTNPALTANATDVFISATSIENNGSEHHFKIEQYSAADGTPGWANLYTVPLTNNSPLPFSAQVNPYAADIDATNNLIIAGAFADSLSLNTTTIATAAGISETFVMSLNANTGVENWVVQSTGSTGRARAWTAGVTPANEIILGGHFTSSVNFGGTAFTSADNTIINPYIAKLNPVDGSQIWVQGFNGQTPNTFNNIYDVDFDSGGNIFYAGSFNDAIDVQGTIISNPINGGNPVDVDAMIGALDTDGNSLWVNQLGGPSTSDEFATTIVYSASSGTVYAGGQLVTDSLHYGGNLLNLPPVSGHYVFGVAPLDGTIDAIPANNISFENTFGYSAVYDDVNNKYIAASLIRGNGQNTVVKQWIPNRPIPLVDITQETGALDPTEILTAFDPGGGTYLYQWYQNGILLAGETFPIYTATLNGEYYVEITSSAGGCPISSDPVYLLDGNTLESDSLALVDLYNSTNGPGWIDGSGWLSGTVDTWFGIIVSGGRVTDINLGFNNLTGTISNSLGQLQALRILDLIGNGVSGQLPQAVWSIPNLQVLQLCCGNNISGTIPPEVGLQPLTVLDLGGNSFTGDLPAELFNVTSLQFINLYDDQDNGMNLTGTLPATIGGLTNLTEFSIASNDITGTLPPEIGNLTSLSVLDLGANQITGPLPIEIGNLANLTSFNLYNNPINSNIPVEWGTLSSLSNFNFEFAQLQGTFPDAIWQIPTLTTIYLSGNNDLNVPLPTNLGSLTQLVDVRIDQTLPRGGPFPTGFYSLTNLTGLSLGAKLYEGTLDGNGVSNWTNLDNIYLWDNRLTGDLPVEFTTLPNLRELSVNFNEFQNIPAFNDATIQGLYIRNNELDFNSIIPNLGINNFVYAPQGRRDTQYLEVAQGGDLSLVNEYTTAGNSYEWVRNVTDSALSASLDYTITGATLGDLGGYRAIITNSEVPDLTVFTPFYNVAFSGAPKSFTVDNNLNSVADFKSMYAAIYGTNAGDTLYVMGSDTDYDLSTGVVGSPRVIYGPGYFLDENPNTQASNLEAVVNSLTVNEAAQDNTFGSGTSIQGLTINTLRLQNLVTEDTLQNVTITSNKVDRLTILGNNNNILVNKNYINQFDFFAPTPTDFLIRFSYNNISIENNIVDSVTSIRGRVTAERFGLNNLDFSNNTISVFLDSIQDATLTNNIIDQYQATGNTTNGTIDFATANFDNTSGTLSIDNDFQTTASAGAFSGAEPYILSGIAPIPRIFELSDIGRIRLASRATSSENVIIESLDYRLGEAGTIVQRGTVRRIEPADTVDVLFRPRLGNVTPNASVRMMLWPKDANGVRGIPQPIEFIAETTTASGQIFEAGGGAVTNGNVLLFEINQEAAAFDTLSTTIGANGNFTFNNIVIGDYLALAEANADDFPGYLPTYYIQTDLWEEADTLLISNTNPTFDITLIPEPQEAIGDGTVTGFIEEEVDPDNAGGRLEVRRRVGRASVSMRRRTRTGRPEEAEQFELVAFVQSDDNGTFTFSNLPADDYRINIQYPGFPMDTLSNVDITIGETVNDAYELSALVDEGKISITVLATTGLFDEIVERITVYPNPATTEGIFVRFVNYANLGEGEVSLELMDVRGNLVNRQSINSSIVLQGEDVKMPLNNARPGTYIIRITQKENELGQARIIIR